MAPETENAEQSAPVIPDAQAAPVAPEADEPADAPAEAPSAPVEAPAEPVAAPTPTPAPVPTQAPAAEVVPVNHAQAAIDPMVNPANSQSLDHLMSEAARKQKAFFESQPKVMMNIPLKDGERAGEAYESVNVNGYRLQIQKGVVVSLPLGVAEILSEHYNIQLGTGGIPEEAQHRIDRSNDSVKALS